MRIICPECKAQYEVPDEAIPPEGRDVQCSDCNATWFVEHAGHPAAAPVEADVAPEPKSGADMSDTDGEGRLSQGGEVAGEETPPPGPPRKELDPDVARILREEARRETEARAADGLEVQPDLGLTHVAPRPSETARKDERPAEPRPDVREPTPGDPEAGHDRAEDPKDPLRTEAAPGVPPDMAPRDDLLPDVEELNSTFRSTGTRKSADDDPRGSGKGSRRRGFRPGFLAAVVIFVIGLLIYQFAPEIAEAAPEVDPWLSAYVTWVDDMRALLDRLVRDVLTWLDGLTAPDV